MKKIIVILSFFLADFALAPLMTMPEIGINLASFTGFVLLFVLTLVFVNKLKNEMKPIAVFGLVLLAVAVLSIPNHFIHYKYTFAFTYITNMIAVVAAFIYLKLENFKAKVVYAIICLAFVLVVSTWGAELWKNCILSISG